MQNIEKYSKQIADIAMESERVAVNRYTGEPCVCSEISCADCAFDVKRDLCANQRKAWAQKEYEEKPKYGMLNDKAYTDLRGVIAGHIDKVYSHCNQSNCANCPYDYSANCRELLLFESMFLDNWVLGRVTVDNDGPRASINEELYSRLNVEEKK